MAESSVREDNRELADPTLGDAWATEYRASMTQKWDVHADPASDANGGLKKSGESAFHRRSGRGDRTSGARRSDSQERDLL